MENYLALIEQVAIENGLCGSILISAAGFVILSLLLSLLISIRSERRLKQLTKTLADERSNSEQERIQLSDNVNKAHEKIQEIEEASNIKTQQLEKTAALEQQLHQRNQQLHNLLTSLEQTLELDVETTTDVSEDGWATRQQQLVDSLIKRLETEEQRCAELSLFLQTGQTMLAEKDIALEALRSSYEEQALQWVTQQQEFAAHLATSEASLAKLHTKYHAYRHYFGRMAWSRMQLCNELNQSNQARLQLETALKNKPAPIIATPDPVVIVADDLPRQAPEPEISLPVVEEPLAVLASPVEPVELSLTEVTIEVTSHVTPEEAPSSKPANALFAKLMNAVKSDFGLKKSTTNIEVQETQVEVITEESSPAPISEPEIIMPAIESPLILDTPPAEPKTSPNSFARFKNVFATKKPEQNSQENEIIIPTEPEPIHIPEANVVLSYYNDENTLDKITAGLKTQWSGLFKKPVTEEPEAIAPIEEPSPSITETPQSPSNMSGQLKGLYQKISSLAKS
ncbi:MAG: hypothetical protein K9L60_05310 [Methylovulum sp.]|nr:hypothetical protein [Methylovulum sp.]MCF7998650.1 hypothetical protein [Methylovulum sp.]